MLVYLMLVLEFKIISQGHLKVKVIEGSNFPSFDVAVMSWLSYFACD